eukprot:c29207_g4_i1 orf=182-346(+)
MKLNSNFCALGWLASCDLFLLLTFSSYLEVLHTLIYGLFDCVGLLLVIKGYGNV